MLSPLSFFSAGICSGLREVRIQIPTAVKKGEPAILNCWYDTEGDPLYTVKWYKGGREFYRYAPNENPVVKIFPIGNLTVKVSTLLPSSSTRSFLCLSLSLLSSRRLRSSTRRPQRRVYLTNLQPSPLSRGPPRNLEILPQSRWDCRESKKKKWRQGEWR